MRAITASPTMVGAITTLIVIVAVFLAYNANNGLPFVPTYQVSVDIPNGSRLVNNNEVRIGGNRVGVVQTVEAVRLEADQTSSGQGDAGTDAGSDPEVIARLQLRLDENAGPLPQDSVFRVRYRSSFGLKYLEITRGSGAPAPEGFLFDGTNDVGDPDATPLTLEEANELQAASGQADGVFVEQTEFDDISNTFDQRTRAAGRQNLVGYGTAFAGRGASLNQAIEALNPLFRGLKPVADTLIARDTRLRRLFPELADSARIVAPIADQQAELFTNLAIAFGALSEDPEALKATISEGPPTLRAGIELLPRQRPFLAEFTELSRRLRPGVSALRAALPSLNSAIRVGTRVLPRTVGMNRDLRNALAQLEKLVEQPETKVTLRRLQDTFDSARPLIEHLAPFQTVCNYWNYDWYGIWEHLSQRDQIGFTERVYTVNFPEDQQGSPAAYSGIQANGRRESDGVFDPDNQVITHGAPYSQAVDERGRADCHSAQHGYPLGELRVPGQPRSSPVLGTSRFPGDPRGTTFTGRPRQP